MEDSNKTPHLGQAIPGKVVASSLVPFGDPFADDCIKGYQEILLPKERLNPSRIQQRRPGQWKSFELVARRLTVPNIESRCNQLNSDMLVMK